MRNRAVPVQAYWFPNLYMGDLKRHEGLRLHYILGAIERNAVHFVCLVLMSTVGFALRRNSEGPRSG
ncbi:hypothetical protein AGR1C_pAt40399 [Agrobacterium fabacearum TT111]|nr:hypothetical protein AGR1C_pAt40399 [Agrobacterium fabacearum TT111]